jgi:hypothetical protein
MKKILSHNSHVNEGYSNKCLLLSEETSSWNEVGEKSNMFNILYKYSKIYYSSKYEMNGKFECFLFTNIFSTN